MQPNVNPLPTPQHPHTTTPKQEKYLIPFLRRPTTFSAHQTTAGPDLAQAELGGSIYRGDEPGEASLARGGRGASMAGGEQDGRCVYVCMGGWIGRGLAVQRQCFLSRASIVLHTPQTTQQQLHRQRAHRRPLRLWVQPLHVRQPRWAGRLRLRHGPAAGGGRGQQQQWGWGGVGECDLRGLVCGVVCCGLEGLARGVDGWMNGWTAPFACVCLCICKTRREGGREVPFGVSTKTIKGEWVICRRELCMHAALISPVVAFVGAGRDGNQRDFLYSVRNADDIERESAQKEQRTCNKLSADRIACGFLARPSFWCHWLVVAVQSSKRLGALCAFASSLPPPLPVSGHLPRSSPPSCVRTRGCAPLSPISPQVSITRNSVFRLSVSLSQCPRAN